MTLSDAGDETFICDECGTEVPKHDLNLHDGDRLCTPCFPLRYCHECETMKSDYRVTAGKTICYDCVPRGLQFNGGDSR